MLISSRPRFEGFGLSQFTEAEIAPFRDYVLDADMADCRRAIRRECEHRPGIYGMWDSDGELIYVGKSKKLRARLLSYFRATDPHEKACRILKRTHTLAWEHASDEFGALLRELELIRRWRPRFNVQGQPGRAGRAFVCVGRAPAPYVYLATQPSSRTDAWFGPVPAGRKTREAIRRLNDAFCLRDCPDQRSMEFADQRDLFPRERAGACLRFELGKCLAPCIGHCTRRQYNAQARHARSFLSGSDGSLLARLEEQMRTASAECQFEHAAAQRDVWMIVAWLADHLARMRKVMAEYRFVYRVAGYQGIETWYLIHGGNVARAISAPRDPASRRAAAELIKHVFDPASPPTLRLDDYSHVLLTAAWFRRRPDELACTLSPGAALELCHAQ